MKRQRSTEKDEWTAKHNRPGNPDNGIAKGVSPSKRCSGRQNPDLEPASLDLCVENVLNEIAGTTPLHRSTTLENRPDEGNRIREPDEPEQCDSAEDQAFCTLLLAPLLSKMSSKLLGFAKIEIDRIFFNVQNEESLPETVMPENLKEGRQNTEVSLASAREREEFLRVCVLDNLKSLSPEKRDRARLEITNVLMKIQLK